MMKSEMNSDDLYRQFIQDEFNFRIDMFTKLIKDLIEYYLILN